LDEFPYHPTKNQGNNINILASAIARAETIHYLTSIHQTRQTIIGLFTGWFLGWLVLVCCERKTLLAGWFGLAETNKRTG